MNALTILSINPGATLQDQGRQGWKRFGIPPGGAMDAASARWANLLVGNRESAPVVEFLFGRASFRAERPVTLALTGAELASSHPFWRSFRLEQGEELKLGFPQAGLWSYLAIEGGFQGEEFFGSCAANERAGLGAGLRVGETLHSAQHSDQPAIAGRFLPPPERPDFGPLAVLPCWKGPEWDLVSAESRQRFLETEWKVSSRSDRAGYRIEGPILNPDGLQILSAPVLVGTVQAPADGQPIVLMRDGPTVGGYPRLALLQTGAVSRLAQCAPGCSIRFEVTD